MKYPTKSAAIKQAFFSLLEDVVILKEELAAAKKELAELKAPKPAHGSHIPTYPVEKVCACIITNNYNCECRKRNVG